MKYLNVRVVWAIVAVAAVLWVSTEESKQELQGLIKVREYKI